MTGSTTITRESQTAGEGAVLTIGGEPQAGAAGSYPVHNPARPAEIVGHAPAADRAQLDAAVSAARRAAPGWRALSVAERVAAVAAAATTAAEQLAARDGARLYTREHGKVLTEANFEISTGPGLAALIGLDGRGGARARAGRPALGLPTAAPRAVRRGRAGAAVQLAARADHDEADVGADRRQHHRRQGAPDLSARGAAARRGAGRGAAAGCGERARRARAASSPRRWSPTRASTSSR